MIAEELFDLKKYLQDNCKGVAVEIGRRDWLPEQYPLIEISQEGDLLSFTNNTKFHQLQMIFQLKIMTDRKNEILAYRTLTNVLTKIANFGDHKGHVLAENHSTEYTDNTFSIKLNYVLRFKIHGT